MNRRLIVLVITLALSPVCFCQAEYFPKLAFDSDERIHSLHANWYSRELKALDEPPLLETSKVIEEQTFRFTWLRSFSNPIAIRLVIDSHERGTLHIKVGLRPANSKFESRTVEITEAEIAKFLKKVSAAGFWNLPSRDDRRGFDGSRWIIEGVTQGRYHVVDRWSPNSGSYQNLGLLLIQLADLKLDSKEIY